MTDLAQFAGQEFRRRQALASQAVANGSWAREQGEAALRAWLAIAAAAGADLPELYEEATQIYPAPQTVRLRYHADEICPPDHWQAELARAAGTILRNPQIAQDRAALDRARGLAGLCRQFGICPPLSMELQEKAA